MVKDLLDEIAEARAEDERSKDRSERIQGLLIRLRREKPDMTLPEIEDLIGRYYDRATISRKTAAALGKTAAKPAPVAAES